MSPSTKITRQAWTESGSFGAAACRLGDFLLLPVLAALLALGCSQTQDSAPSETQVGETAAPQQGHRFDRLKGRWLRPDGGYILEIRAVNEEGKVQAAYYNPRPINVSTARVRGEGQRLSLFVELRDEGYPGSYYQLVYSPEFDQLVGVYFQAAQQATYEVQFIRAP